MDASKEIEDPSDWLHTSLATFLPLDNALRCQVCKDFYHTPMITSCSHTFCSKCIRTCLSSDGKCPTCRAADQASKLRNNLAIEEAVGAFVIARPAAFKIALKDRLDVDEGPRRPGKRRRTSYTEVAEVQGEAQPRRQTRSMRSRGAAEPAKMQANGAVETIDVSDGDDDEEEYKPEDGLVPCPMCDTRMKESEVFGHLDTCDGKKKQDKGARASRTPVNVNPLQRPPSRPQSAKPQERLAELNYSLLKENALRKKLQELGLPTIGNKTLLKERHTEWINIWNANCDSSNPKSKGELLNELKKWERSQGGQARELDNAGIMKKDFDAVGWQANHTDDFSRLIEQARRKRNEAANKPKEEGEDKPAAIEQQQQPQAEEEDASAMDVDAATTAFPPVSPFQAAPPSLRQRKPAKQATESNHNPSRPYENNPEAMSSIRAKVEALNAGEKVEPLMNEGFKSPEQPRSAQSPSLPRSGQSEVQSPVNGINGSVVPTLRKDASLPEHFAEPADRKVNMFAVPEEPVSDNEAPH